MAKYFFDTSTIALAASNLPDLTGKRREAIREMVTKACPNARLAQTTSLSNAFDRFVNHMYESDIILMPDEDTIYIGEIQSSYLYSAEDKSNCPHKRMIKPLRIVDRKELSADLRKAIRAHYQIVSLNAYAEEVYALAFSVPREADAAADTKSEIAVKLVEVKYPLRPNFEIKLTIPNDTTADEAERLGIFFRSLYFRK